MRKDWELRPEDWEFARNEGMTDAEIERETAEFIDYWIGVAGQKGVKLDWPATWRNRVRKGYWRRGRERTSAPTTGIQAAAAWGRSAGRNVS